jgi:tRNA A-37 threonylcarbamoyl transferase component Bud32
MMKKVIADDELILYRPIPGDPMHDFIRRKKNTSVGKEIGNLLVEKMHGISMLLLQNVTSVPI